MTIGAAALANQTGFTVVWEIGKVTLVLGNAHTETIRAR